MMPAYVISETKEGTWNVWRVLYSSELDYKFCAEFQSEQDAVDYIAGEDYIIVQGDS